MREKDSVAVYFVRAALYGLRNNPQRRAQLLCQAGIAEELLDDPRGRVAALQPLALAGDVQAVQRVAEGGAVLPRGD